MNHKNSQSYRLFSFVSKTFLLAAVIAGSFGFGFAPKAEAAAAADVWWPVNGVTVSGIQPFKAVVANVGIEAYSMYWQVDNGQMNLMENNYTGYPHKESSVNLTGWTWKGSGPYILTFTAKNQNGAVIAEKNVSITVASSVQTQQVITPSTQVQTIPVPPTPVPIPAPTPVPTADTQVWWPVNGVTVSGIQPFKAVVNGQSLSSYKMYWQVDNGGKNEIPDNNTGTPHKESLIDLSGWTWKGRGPYTLKFTATDLNGKEIGTKSAVIYVDSSGPTNQTSSTVPTGNTSGTTQVQTTTTNSSGVKLYVNKNNNASRQADAWRNSRPNDAAQMDKIATQSQAQWFGGWNSNLASDVNNLVSAASAEGAVPVLIAYNIPQRDCGSYSAGGAGSPDGYRNWIKTFADAIGNRKAIVVLEPDAITLTDCLGGADKETRFSLLREAVSLLKSKGSISVYIDAGHPSWHSPSVIAERLKNAGVAQADGFSLNVSNFYGNSENSSYGAAISNLIGGKHFIIDTSRNGNGSNGEWCNPSGRALGTRPTTLTGNSLIDAFLWLKAPGESDGSCNGAPGAGTWWPEYALGLAQRASY